MSSELKAGSSPQPQPQPQPRSRDGRAGNRGAGGPDPGRQGAAGAAGAARALGRDPDDPAAWPGGAREVPAESPVVSDPPVAGPAAGAPVASDPAAAAAEDPADDSFTLTDAKAMRALAHPLRMAILELFSVRETLTATQASETLGESPANCAFHLRTLAKYGFVREAGGGKGRERPWTRVNRSLTVSTDQPDPQAALAAEELSRLWLERWMERARRIYGSRNMVPGWDEASGWSGSYLFLTPDETVRLREQMRRILNRYEDRVSDPALRPEGALPMEWMIFTAPVPELADPNEPDPLSRVADPGAGG
jgi:Helix-turn-helix domain